MGKLNKSLAPNTLVNNRRARHDYFIEQCFEAGLVLTGWEVKSIRKGQVQLHDSYAAIMKDELWLLGSSVTPLVGASSHIVADPHRSRKLLLHRSDINKLIAYKQQAGHTIVPLSLYLKKGRIKCQLGLAKGKKQQDKRAVIKERDWQRQRQRLLQRH